MSIIDPTPSYEQKVGNTYGIRKIYWENFR